jgi:hypothetical protein
MQRESKIDGAPVRRRRRLRSGDVSLRVVELGRRFARFRAEYPKGTRIPAELRAAVVDALAQGAASGEVERACRVTWSQVKAWQALAGRESVAAAVAEKAVRVFSVVDEGPADGSPAVAGAEQELELRLGPWSVSVRLARPAQAGGGQTCCR